MNDELNKELSALAAKLGTSAEHLWSVLIRQAYIDGISSAVTVLVCVLVAAVTVFAFLYLRTKFKGQLDAPLSMLMEPIGFVILGVVLLVIVTIAADNLYWVVSDFFNPEFYAWRELSKLAH